MGYCSAVTPAGWRWIVDAHRAGRRYIIHSDELLDAFLELEANLLYGALQTTDQVQDQYDDENCAQDAMRPIAPAVPTRRESSH